MHKFVVGDAATVLQRRGVAASVQCVVTSPPYFGQRDYGIAGQIGHEETPEVYVQALVRVFRQVHRVLKADGTVWLNLGDSYNAHPGQRKTTDRVGPKQSTNAGSNTIGSRNVVDMKPKDLLGIPWRVAFALQADGWYLRSDIIWAKPNPMPESVTDRPTRSHEYLFLLTKAAKYYYDAAAIKEEAVGKLRVRQDQFGGAKYNGKNERSGERRKVGFNERWDRTQAGKHSDQSVFVNAQTRNKRSVWTIVPVPYKGAHFATFPPALVEPCILAGSRPNDWVLDPFMGSGTVGVVAAKHGRHFLGIDLQADYHVLAEQRMAAGR